MTKFETVEAYFDAVPPDRRARLDELRAVARSVAPDAAEQVLYDMPAYKLGGRFLVSFAWFKAHDSLYPASRVVLETVPEAEAYAKGRGTFQFPIRDQLPMEVIRRIVEARVAELATEGPGSAEAPDMAEAPDPGAEA